MLKKGKWNLSDLDKVQKNGKKVFSIFHCGGGSTMGYKLSGFDVLGGVEIDKQMMEVYRKNHNPKISYLCSIVDFNKIKNEDLPKELFDLDILDGSPPCSSFSMAGSREKKWGVKKKFREGQTEQVLDDLFFHFIETARKLQPKIVVAENVKGLIIGKAKGYVKQIFQMFNLAGYETQLFLLNSAFMGVPQKRERTFFIARRKELRFPKIKLEFNEKTISCGEVWSDINSIGKELNEFQKKLWSKAKQGDSLGKVHVRGSYFNWTKLNINEPSNTITSGPATLHPHKPNHISNEATIRLQAFPDDYNFLNLDTRYICGMSVPPFMMQRISNQIYLQLLKE